MTSFYLWRMVSSKEREKRLGKQRKIIHVSLSRRLSESTRSVAVHAQLSLVGTSPSPFTCIEDLRGDSRCERTPQGSSYPRFLEQSMERRGELGRKKRGQEMA